VLVWAMACVWLCAAPRGCAQEQPLDLRAALAAADSSNLELRAARQQRALAIAGITTARQLPNPTIAFTASRDTPHEGVSLDLPIELGGQRRKRIDVAKEEQKSTEIDIAAMSRQIRRRTRVAFYQSLAAKEQAAQARTALDLATRMRELAQQRYDAGDVAELEVLQADVEMARASADYETAAHAQRTADVELAALLNRRLEEPLQLAGQLRDVPAAPALNTVTDQAMQTSSDLVKTLQELKTEESRLALAKSQRIPNLDLSVGSDFNSPPDFRAGPKGGLGITLPLFYHGQGEVAVSTARLELLRLTLAFQRNSVAAEVAGAYFDYVAKSHQVQQYRDRVLPESVRLEEMAEESYRSGKTNVLTLLDSQRRLSDVNKTYLDNLLAAQNSFAVLEEAVGAPLD